MAARYGMASGQSLQATISNLKEENEILVKIVKDLLQVHTDSNPDLILKYSEFLAKDNNE